MNKEIGSFEAKTKLPELLRGVQNGERYTITLRGKAVADLVPCESAARIGRATAVEAMRNFPKVKGVSTETLLEMIAQGRK